MMRCSRNLVRLLLVPLQVTEIYKEKENGTCAVSLVPLPPRRRSLLHVCTRARSHARRTCTQRYSRGTHAHARTPPVLLSSYFCVKTTGLIKLAKQLGHELLPPQQKITVLLVGNHSAGKSSFINWYVGQKIQRTGTAMETSGFTFITSGKKRESLTGEATINLLPHMKGLKDCAGVADCITTEIVTSHEKSFPLITFVDSPGLIDGDALTKYPYDIDAALKWLGRSANLVFVFFDPIGQALRKHTLDVVESMCSDKNSDYKKMHFYLSKADIAGNAKERQKVMIQMSKDLYGNPIQRPGMAKVGTHAEVPTIFIPREDGPESDCPNQIDEVCQLMDKSIASTVQSMLNTLKKDTGVIADLIDKKLAQDEQDGTNNMSARLNGIFYFWMGILIPTIVIMIIIINTAGQDKLEEIMPANAATVFLKVGGAAMWIWGIVPDSYTWHFVGGFILFTMGMLWYSKYVWKVAKRLSSAEKKQMQETKKFLEGDVTDRYEALYKQYLDSAVGEDCKM